MEEGKGQGGLATSHQYGNALLGVCYQEEEEEGTSLLLPVPVISTCHLSSCVDQNLSCLSLKELTDGGREQ